MAQVSSDPSMGAEAKIETQEPHVGGLANGSLNANPGIGGPFAPTGNADKQAMNGAPIGSGSEKSDAQGHKEDTSEKPTAQMSTSNATIDGSTNPVVTPFIQSHPSSTLPQPHELSPDQQAKYTTLLQTVHSWTLQKRFGTQAVETNSSVSTPTPLSATERIWLTRECLLRYLRAAKWSLPNATTRLKATLEWRRSYNVEAHTAEYISEENATGKQVIMGYDNDGRPCLYLNPHLQNTKDKDKQVQHLVFMLERCIDLMPPGVETLDLLVNFRDSRKGENASLSQGRQSLSILQNHYPERLGKSLVMDVPWLIWGFFKAISPFIDPLTKEKMKFDQDLTKLIPPAQLMERFGGTVKFEYVHDKYWPALNGLAEQRRREAMDRWERAGSRVGESERYLKGEGEPVVEDQQQHLREEKADHV